jgi:hypothetical protein
MAPTGGRDDALDQREVRDEQDFEILSLRHGFRSGVAARGRTKGQMYRR